MEFAVDDFSPPVNSRMGRLGDLEPSIVVHPQRTTQRTTQKQKFIKNYIYMKETKKGGSYMITFYDYTN
jgi:hypothetical protein